MSRKHHVKHLSEMTWRFNPREMDAGDRVNALLTRNKGRLTYKALTA